MALDESKDTDQEFDIDGFKYIVDKEFMEKVKPIKVDFIDIGFRLSCSVDFSAGGGNSCSGCGSAGSCG